MLLADTFSVGAELTTTFHEGYQKVCVQTATGQMRASQIFNDLHDNADTKLEDWEHLCSSCGIWTNIQEKLLPLISEISESHIDTLDRDFQRNIEFRKQCVHLLSKEPPSAIGDNLSDLAKWVINSLPHVKTFKDQIKAERAAVGDSLPGAILGKEEAAELNSINYVAGFRVDIDNFRRAAKVMDDENSTLMEQWKVLHVNHVTDVKRFQKAMQGSDLTFWEPSVKKKLRANKDWMSVAAQEAQLHKENLKKVLGCRDEDILQINVFTLYMMGTTKKNTLNAIKSVLPSLKGISLIFYPFMPRCTHRVQVGGDAGNVEVGDAAAADGAASDSDTDVDVEMHDYTADGVLPEALTTLHSVKTAAQKAAQLAADWGDIDTELGLSNIRVRYPKRITFLHKADVHGDKATTCAQLLLPVDDSEGVNMESLKESIMMSSGTYTEVPVTSSFTMVSRKAANQCKRALIESWKYEGASTVDSSQRFAASKISRQQVGVGLHETWLKDIMATCGKKCVYVVNLAHGPGEVGEAVISSKVSVEATANGVRACLFSHDPRFLFSELGRARCLTKIGQLYMDKKLILPGHVPVESPGEKPERSKKMLKALLPAPLKVLAMGGQGELILPDDVELNQACPHTLPESFTKELVAWRAEFPRPQNPVKADKADETEQTKPAHGGEAEAPKPESAAAQGGTVKINEEAVDKDLNEKIVKKCELPATGPKAMALEYGLAQTASDGYRVWVHNRSAKDVTLPVGTYMGAGGPGAFLSLVSNQPTEAQKKHAYRWTRYTSCKQDKAENANAYLVLNKGVPADGGKPKLSNFDELEKELGNGIQLYGHAITRGGRGKVTITPAPTPVAWVPTLGEEQSIAKFSCTTLGNFMPSLEDTTASFPKLLGYVRPVFEVTTQQPAANGAAAKPKAKAAAAASPPGMTIRPNSQMGHQAVHLFLCKKIDIPAGAWFAMH